MLVTTGCHPLPRAQIMPNSAVCRLHFALTYGGAMAGDDGEGFDSRTAPLALRGFHLLATTHGEDQEKSPWGSTARCGEKLFSTVLIY